MPPSEPVVGSTALLLRPGVNEFIYNGPPIPLTALLAPVVGKYRSVTFRAPNGLVVRYTPGSADTLVVVPGTILSIDMAETGTVYLPAR